MISKARVPIIKLVFRNGIAADVSVGSTNGLEAVGAVLAMQREEPLLAPLVLALKAFLRARGLNEAFNGGISSYVLTLMAACHVRMARAGASARSREQPRPGGEPASSHRPARYERSRHVASSSPGKSTPDRWASWW